MAGARARSPTRSRDADRRAEHLHGRASGDEERFLRAVTGVRRSRLRTGAVRWGLYRDGQNPRAFVELYVVRQHTDRLTGADERFEEDADALSSAPETSHLIEAKLPEG